MNDAEKSAAEAAAKAEEEAKAKAKTEEEAKAAADAKDRAGKKPVRLLAESKHGALNKIVYLTPKQAEELVAEGLADDRQASLDYAAKLPVNLPK